MGHAGEGSGRGERGSDGARGCESAIGVAAANILCARGLLDGLVAGGVRHVVVSPGSRSTPLVWAAHAQNEITITVQIDERSAAFFALGIAKATGVPAALVCTSGTAAANYFPAVVEASMASVPLVLLTADRPPEARGTGAPQTIDQVGLYGGYVRLFRDLPCPDASSGKRIDEWIDAAVAAGREACATARALPAGPVHLNIPYREPLVPTAEEIERIDAIWGTRERERHCEEHAAPALPSMDALADRIAHARRPLIVAGPEAVAAGEETAVLGFARTAGIPVFADISSGLRIAGAADGILLCAHADLFLRDGSVAQESPDLVIRLGGVPTSKTIGEYLARHRPHVAAIQPDARRRDPDGVVRATYVGSAGAICERLASRIRRPVDVDPSWPSLLAEAESAAHAIADDAPFEAAAVRAACAGLPHGAILFLSNSMPIRWAEAYTTALPAGVRVLVNRGANGIDGIISTALGAARGTDLPLLLVTGDLALLHDLGGLRAARGLRRPVAILVLNNNGGGIFSHLPIADYPEIGEPLFGTPHDCDLGSAVRAFGIDHRVASSDDRVGDFVRDTFASGGVRVIEVPADRAGNARAHAAVARRIGVREHRIDAGGISWRVRTMGSRGHCAPLVLLHGFTGTGEFWLPISRRIRNRLVVFPDLPGHGGTAAPIPPEEWRLSRAAEAIVGILDRLEIDRCGLAGYSMGGRLALHVALDVPERIERLVLFGASPGIDCPGERLARTAVDLELAASIERDGIEAFADGWESQPLFATQAALPARMREVTGAERRSQDPARLAAALRAFGTGWQEPLHDRLPSLRMPALLVAGEYDGKYAQLARDMAGRIPGAAVRIVAGAGHAVPLERAAECASLIDSFLKGGPLG